MQPTAPVFLQRLARHPFDNASWFGLTVNLDAALTGQTGRIRINAGSSKQCLYSVNPYAVTNRRRDQKSVYPVMNRVRNAT